MRLFLPKLFLALCSLTCLTTAAHLSLSIQPSNILSNPSQLPPSTRATILGNGHTLTAPITRRNTFEFKHLLPGSYLLTFQCRDCSFSPLRVDVSQVGDVTDGAARSQERIDVWQTFLGNEWRNKGEYKGGGQIGDEQGAVVVEVRPDRVKEYYMQRTGFSVIDFFKNPMILMSLVSLGMIVGLPYIMDNMDAETKAEFEEIQKESPLAKVNPATQLRNFDLAGWMAGKSAGSGAETSKSTSGGDGGGSVSRRRG